MISIIIPFYNEKDSLLELVTSLAKAITKLTKEYEVVLVNDGSTDDPDLEKLPSSCLKIVSHRKRSGKGKALKTGIDNSSGDMIVFMDADLQDDPRDLTRFYQKIQSGYDFVNGVRTNRRDNLLIKIYSLLAKKFLQIFLHSPFTDINCGFKMFRREILHEVFLYGNNFRFLPLAAFYQGFKVTEIPVSNHPRIYGRSKFGNAKVFTGILDTVTAYFIYKFAETPLHFFGPVGLTLFLPGTLITGYLVYERVFLGVLLYRRPALLLAILLIIVGLQIIMTGIIGELIVYLNKKVKSSM